MSTVTLDLQKQLDLRKDQVINLKKEIGLRNQKAAVILALDFSGSMNWLYQGGQIQRLIERLLPLGLAFDDNGEVDFYLFDTTVKKLPENITLKNIEGYISNKVIGKYEMGGTKYAPVIKKIVDDFAPKASGGFLGLGKKSGSLKDPVYVIFITDGENDDKAKAEKEIIEASKHGIFFQFVGIGSSQFTFLEKLDTMSGRFMDNANFFQVNDLSNKSDDDLYRLLLKEFPTYVYDARVKQLID